MSRFVIACGGTGGHLSPGIALAEVLTARGHTATLFISQKRVDARLVEQYPHLALARVPGAPFGLRPDVLARFLLKQSQGLWFSWRFLRRERPAAIIGFGGFTNAAVVVAGRALGIPIALHEANRVPGRAVRRLASLASRVYLPPGVQLAARHAARTRHTGLPVRQEISRLPQAEARALLGVDPKQKLLVILGGSQGSSNLNQWVEAQLPAFAAAGVQVYCVTGLGKGAAGVRELRTASGAPVRAWFEAFSDRVGVLMSAADLVVSRAGAGTIAELVRCETPAILIPYPHAADNHQQANAEYLTEQGGAVLVADSALSGLAATVQALLAEETRLAGFRAALHRLAEVNCAELIARDLEEITTGKTPAAPLPSRQAASLVL